MKKNEINANDQNFFVFDVVRQVYHNEVKLSQNKSGFNIREIVKPHYLLLDDCLLLVLTEQNFNQKNRKHRYAESIRSNFVLIDPFGI